MPKYFSKFPITTYDFEGNNNKRFVRDLYRAVKAYSAVDEFVGYTKYDILDGERPDQTSQRLYDTPDYWWTFFMINETLSDGLIDWPKGGNELKEYIDLKYSGTVLTFFRDSGDATLDDHFVRDNFIAGEDLKDTGDNIIGRVASVDPIMNRIFVDSFTTALTSDNYPTLVTGVGNKSIVANENYSWSVEDEKLAAHHYTDANGDEVQRLYFADNGDGLTEVTNREYEEDLNDSKRAISVIRPGYIAEFAKGYERLLNA